MKNLEKFMDAIESNSFFELEYLKIKITDRCNLTCVGCDFWKRKDLAELETEMIYSILDQGRELGAKSVHLSGGEATIRDDLINIINYANFSNYNVRMVTNGTQLNRQLIEHYVDAGLNAITFSLDSSKKELNKNLRGKENNWKKVISNISVASEYQPNLEVGINTVVSKKNLDELEDIVKLANELSVSWIRLSVFDKNQEVLHTGKIKQKKIFTKDQISRYNNIILPKIDKYMHETKQVIYPNHLHIFGFTAEEHKNSERGDYSKKFYADKICFLPFTHLSIYPNGDVMPCCKIPLIEGVMGNVYKSSLKEIAKNSIAKEYREKIRTTGIEACNSCTMKTYDNIQKYKQFKKELGVIPKKK
ncbi:MAG: radical SAM/SPASM domain-containing protein [bacterium]